MKNTICLRVKRPFTAEDAISCIYQNPSQTAKSVQSHFKITLTVEEAQKAGNTKDIMRRVRGGRAGEWEGEEREREGGGGGGGGRRINDIRLRGPPWPPDCSKMRAAKVNTVCVVIMINMSVYLSNKIITVAVSFKQDHGSQHNSDL